MDQIDHEETKNNVFGIILLVGVILWSYVDFFFFFFLGNAALSDFYRKTFLTLAEDGLWYIANPTTIRTLEYYKL